MPQVCTPCQDGDHDECTGIADGYFAGGGDPCTCTCEP
jgi:hypothetical protein